MKIKRFFIPVFALLAMQAAAQNKQQPVSSKIERVTVFSSGAQVTRAAKCSIPQGKTELVFGGISPNIESKSIQAKAEGNFTILSVIHQVNYLNENDRRAETEVLMKQKEGLKNKISIEKAMLAVYKNEEAMLAKNQSVGGSTAGLKTADLKEAVDFHRARLTEVFQKQTDIERGLQKLDSAEQQINKQLKALNQTQNFSTSEVLVTVMAKEPATASFEIGYFAYYANWYATYDVRVKDISSPIDLSFKANISQNSGEDWKDIKLSISTGNPTESGVAPAMQPWYLRFGYPEVYLEDKAYRMEIMRDEDDSESQKESEKSGYSADTAYSPSFRMQTSEKQNATTLSFEIETPYTVLNDGKEYVADIKNMSVPAIYQYFTVPKLSKDAFLTAKITDWQDLNLLGGEANLFFEGAYLGKSLLDPENAGDTLNISLGKDKGIVINRKSLKEFASKRFLGANKTEERAFEISVRNNKPQAVKILVQDQFPIPTDKDIEVSGQEYKEARLEPDTQKVIWEYELPSKQEKKHLLKYSVKYPKNKIVVLE